jgi:alpha-D-ribose 1-methylphosphonate 5-triphosphate synthase subunit PhnI
MERIANDRERRRRKAWVERVLDLLDSDNLIAEAAALHDSDQDLLFDCNFAPEVWDDPRITFRLRQLANNDVTVELVDHESIIAGRTFKRAQIRVKY